MPMQAYLEKHIPAKNVAHFYLLGCHEVGQVGAELVNHAA